MSEFNGLYNEIYQGLKEIPAYDVHTHINEEHMSARGLDDILLYHMVVSDLYSAGCPSGGRLSEFPQEEYRLKRLKEAVSYIENIRNTSCYFGVRTILKDLYGIDEEISENNYIKIDAIIKSKSGGEFARQTLKKCNIKKTTLEYVKRSEGKFDDIAEYSLEWAFFTRSQWGQFDTALIELEYAWGCASPGDPLPVTIGGDLSFLKKHIKTVDDVDEAMRYYCSLIPYNKVISHTQHISTDIAYRTVTKDEMAAALKNRSKAGPRETEIYANYIHEKYLTALEERKTNMVLQYSIGAEPLPYETGAKLRSETVFDVARLAARHSGLKFVFYLATQHQDQAFCTLARELPNVYLAGYWWHNFFPSVMSQIIAERIDMLSPSKVVGFFSDAYCTDWTYGKAVIVKKQLAKVLAEKVAQGQFSLNVALEYAKKIMHDTPKNLFNIKE